MTVSGWRRSSVSPSTPTTAGPEALLAEVFGGLPGDRFDQSSLRPGGVAPRLPPAMLREALSIVQVISDDDDRQALAALAPYLLRSRTDPEVASAVAARHAPSTTRRADATSWWRWPGSSTRRSARRCSTPRSRWRRKTLRRSVSRGSPRSPSLDYTTRPPRVRPGVGARGGHRERDLRRPRPRPRPSRARRRFRPGRARVAPGPGRCPAGRSRDRRPERRPPGRSRSPRSACCCPRRRGAGARGGVRHGEAADSADARRVQLWEVDAPLPSWPLTLAGRKGLRRARSREARATPSGPQVGAEAVRAGHRRAVLRGATAEQPPRGPRHGARPSLKDSLAALAPALDEPDRSAALSEALPTPAARGHLRPLEQHRRGPGRHGSGGRLSECSATPPTA